MSKTEKAETTAVTKVEATSNNEVQITPPEKLLEACILVSKGVSADIVSHTGRLLNYVLASDECKKNNKFSFALIADAKKEAFKNKCFNYYMKYKFTQAPLPYLRALGYVKGDTYNIKAAIEKFELRFENAMKEAGIIDKDCNILKPDLYTEWMNKARLFTNETEIAEQYKAGNIIVPTYDMLYRKESVYFNKRRESSPFTEKRTKHVRMTVQKIQDLFEKAVSIKFEQPLFAYSVS